MFCQDLLLHLELSFGDFPFEEASEYSFVLLNTNDLAQRLSILCCVIMFCIGIPSHFM